MESCEPLQVQYQCTNGSMFDTDGDGEGETDLLNSTCKWRKSWEPWGPTTQPLPPCRITHCIWPPAIPPTSFMEEVNNSWTAVNTSKEYRCQVALTTPHTVVLP